MSPFKSTSILVVEDDELLREVVGDFFRDRSANVTEADNGTKALTLVKEQHFDVILSDVRMPGGDGLTLAKEVSKLDGHKPLFFIYSGYNDITKAQAIEFNILKIFEKPFDHKVFLEEISAALRNRDNKKTA